LGCMSDEHDHSSETILVVDGDVIARTVISGYLRHSGYRVIEANIGEEALQALQHDKFDVTAVLSDVVLPGELSGFDVAQWMRQNRPGVPIVLSSAVERAAEIAGDLCEQGPAPAMPYDPKAVIDYIKRLKAR
jgi:CheY-like chemotaxis protein